MSRQIPEYNELLYACLDEVRPFADKVIPGMQQREAFIFISSPGSVTPFHIDPEHNFLLQIRGNKKVYMFDRSDREILPELKVESYYTGGHRNLDFDEDIKSRGKAYELQPGDALHFPVNDPHWVQNGDQVSVSFSITFRSDWSKRRAKLYFINSKLRGVGLRPAPVGKSALRDTCKYAAFQVAKKGAKILRGDSTPPCCY